MDLIDQILGGIRGKRYANSKGGYVASDGTIHPIDTKYLPGVCLPVVEATTEPTPEGAQCTAAEAEQLNKAAALGLPAVYKCNWTGTKISSFLIYSEGSLYGDKNFVVLLPVPGSITPFYYLGADGESWFVTFTTSD